MVSATLYIDVVSKARNKKAFDLLYSEREIIESQLGESLEWDRPDHRKASRIHAVRSGSIDDDDEVLEEVRQWIVDRLLAFKSVFGPA